MVAVAVVVKNRSTGSGVDWGSSAAVAARIFEDALSLARARALFGILLRIFGERRRCKCFFFSVLFNNEKKKKWRGIEMEVGVECFYVYICIVCIKLSGFVG